MKRIIVALAAVAVSGPGLANGTSFKCEPQGEGTVIQIKGDYGLTQYRKAAGAGSVYDARGASWMFNNSTHAEPYYPLPDPEGNISNEGACDDPDGPLTSNLYPVILDMPSNSCFQGGVFHGQVSLTSLWRRAYCNAAAFFFKDPTGPVTVEGVRIDRAWDGIRINKYLANTEHTIRNVWMSNVRDDCIDMDGQGSARIENSLLDKCFVGISSRGGSTNRRQTDTVTVDNVLLRIGVYAYNASYTSPVYYDWVMPFKWATVAPALALHNSVVAIPAWNPGPRENWAETWNAMADGGCSNNVFLWLSDAAYPWHPSTGTARFWPWAETGKNTEAQCRADNDLPGCKPLPACFTVVKQGRAAHEHWNAERARWISTSPIPSFTPLAPGGR